jgi:hypothetical protein
MQRVGGLASAQADDRELARSWFSHFEKNA